LGTLDASAGACDDPALAAPPTKTSTAKYKALVNATSADGRLRNTSQFMGASRTGRWAHRLFQPGNLPRGTLSEEELEVGIDSLINGYWDLA